jgi:hypothetical protein
MVEGYHLAFLVSEPASLLVEVDRGLFFLSRGSVLGPRSSIERVYTIGYRLATYDV